MPRLVQRGGSSGPLHRTLRGGADWGCERWGPGLLSLREEGAGPNSWFEGGGGWGSGLLGLREEGLGAQTPGLTEEGPRGRDFWFWRRRN